MFSSLRHIPRSELAVLWEVCVWLYMPFYIPARVWRAMYGSSDFQHASLAPVTVVGPVYHLSRTGSFVSAHHRFTGRFTYNSVPGAQKLEVGCGDRGPEPSGRAALRSLPALCLEWIPEWDCSVTGALELGLGEGTGGGTLLGFWWGRGSKDRSLWREKDHDEKLQTRGLGASQSRLNHRLLSPDRNGGSWRRSRSRRGFSGFLEKGTWPQRTE